jgi:hypothetical protein
MLKQATIDKLHEMRMSTMARYFEQQCSSHDFDDFSFEDRFSMLVDKEWDKRRSNKKQRLIRSADFRFPGACKAGIRVLVVKMMPYFRMPSLIGLFRTPTRL